MIFLDTGYLIAVLESSDQHHQRARKWSAAVRDQLLVTEHVLWETINFFSELPGRQKVHPLIQEVRQVYVVVTATPSLFDEGLKLHRGRPDKEWSLTDCISFVVMEQHGIKQALTFDHHFEQAGFEALLRRDPP